MKMILSLFIYLFTFLPSHSQTEIYDYEYLAMCDADTVSFYRLTLSKPDVDTIIYIKQFIPTALGFVDYTPLGTVSAGTCSAGAVDAGCCETASNVGVGGVGVYEGQTGLNFDFRNINAGSGKISVTLDAGNFEIDLDVVDSLLEIEIYQVDSLYWYLQRLDSINLFQKKILWQEDGLNRGTAGSLDTVNFAGYLRAINSGGKLTVTVDGLHELNGLDTVVQYLQVDEAGSNFNILSSGSTHTFNLPVADVSTTGKLSNTDWNTFNSKVSTSRTISTTLPLAGGGDLSANRTFSLTNGDYTDIYATSNWQVLNIDTGAVGTLELADSAVTNLKMATNSVDSNNIIALNVTTTDLKDSSVTREKILNTDFWFERKYEYLEDFTSLIGNSPGNGHMFLTTSSGAMTIGGAMFDTLTVGEVKITTGTSATGKATVGTSYPTFTFSNAEWRYAARVRHDTLSTAAQRFQSLVGFFANPITASPTDGVYFLYDEGGVTTGSAASANWQCVTIENSARTFTTSTVAVATTAYQKLEILVNKEQNEALFYIDGVLEATHTTNIPNNTRKVAYGATIVKTIGTIVKMLSLDYIYSRANFTIAR